MVYGGVGCSDMWCDGVSCSVMSCVGVGQHGVFGVCWCVVYDMRCVACSV